MKKFFLLLTLVVFSFFNMKAQIETPENLHVSPTGWAQWTSNANPEQPEYGETFSYPFNQDINGWTLIDGNHDDRNCEIGFDPLGGAWEYCAFINFMGRFADPAQRFLSFQTGHDWQEICFDISSYKSSG